MKKCTHTLNKHVYIEYLVYCCILISLTMRCVKTITLKGEFCLCKFKKMKMKTTNYMNVLVGVQWWINYEIGKTCEIEHLKVHRYSN